MVKTSSIRCDVDHGGDEFTLTFYRRPVPASRPRVTRWGTYYLKTYKAYKDDAHTAIPMCTVGILTGNLSATIEFVCYRPKTTKRSNPLGDIDNHCKSILDAIVGTAATSKRSCMLKKYIEDDMQITVLKATKRYAKADEEPRTSVTVRKV